MKLSNIELLRVIWRQQLLNLSSGVLISFVGGGKGLCDEGEFWRHGSQMVARSQQERYMGFLAANKRLCGTQGARRVSELIELGHLSRPSGRKKDDFYYLIDTVLSFEAWLYARKYWTENGVPETGHDVIENYESKLFDLQTQLITQFKL